MKTICDYHMRNPDQTGSMNCHDCNTCSECGEVYWQDSNKIDEDDPCPKCGEPGFI